MNRIFRPFLAILLALMLLATTGAMASARGMMRDPAGQMVLCLGTGSVTVNVDADGQPIEAGHICPDCALGHFDALVPQVSEPALVERHVQILHVAAVKLGRGAVSGQARARSPPLV